MPTAYSFDGSRLQPLDWHPARTLRWAAWRPDGAVVLAVGNGGSAVLSDGARFDYLATASKQNLRGAAWSPDGSTALLVGNRGAVLRLRGESIEELSGVTTENLRRVAWHPSGAYALVVGNAGTVLRYDAAVETLSALPGDRAHTLRSVAFRATAPTRWLAPTPAVSPATRGRIRSTAATDATFRPCSLPTTKTTSSRSIGRRRAGRWPAATPGWRTAASSTKR